MCSFLLRLPVHIIWFPRDCVLCVIVPFFPHLSFPCFHMFHHMSDHSFVFSQVCLIVGWFYMWPLLEPEEPRIENPEIYTMAT